MDNFLKRLLDRRNRPAWLVLTVCLMLTWLTWSGLREQAMKAAEQQFDLMTSDTQDAIRDRMVQHEQILLGGAGLFDASDAVSRSEWRTYVERLQLGRNYPGIQGVGFSQAIRPAGLLAHIAGVRAEGYREYRVRPAGERPLYTSIIYLEPFSGRNLAAFGFDMMSEATRAKALRLAAETGKTTITGKVKLVQETHGKPQAGFLMYVPVFRQHQAADTPAERWQALRGFVYSPYRMGDLMRGILGEQINKLDFSIFDGTQEGDDARLYATREDEPSGTVGTRPLLTTSRTIQLYGHAWTVRFQSRPDFESAFDSSLLVAIPLMGGGIGVLMFLLVSFLIFRRDQAEAIAHEMTEGIRRGEQELRKSQQLLNSIVEHIPAMVFMKRASDLRFELFNRTGEKLLGHKRDDLLGKNDYDFFPEEQAAGFTARDREVLASRQALDIPEELVSTAGGETRHLHTIKVGLRDEQDRPAHLLGISIDITEQKLQERVAREHAQQTRIILDNVIDGIITIDGLGTVQSMNRAAVSIFGYDPDEVIGRNINMLMPEPYHSQHDAYLKNYRDTGVPRIIGIGREVVGQRKDGGTFPMDLAVSRSVHQGQPLFIGLVRDITERKHVDQMKTEFVSTVSHELRTPLTSISGSLGLIVGGALGEVPEQFKSMLEIAHKNSLRLTHLINDLLDMEKLAAGKMRFDMQVQPLMPLVEQALENNRAYAKQHQVRLVLSERADDVQVRVDGDRLQQVLSNFLSNAAKFSPRGSWIEVAVRQDKNTVQVEVIDRGPGIPAAFRGKVFQNFSQADASDTRQKGGTGLGLAISKELIERMNGLIGFDSEEGRGTRFHFVLPLWRAQAAATELAAAETSGAPRLLVVEDEPEIARLLSLMLTRAGYNVDVAHDAETALSFLARRGYAAMTLDLMLPDHTGVALMRRIRGRAETEALPIVVVSAFSEDGRLAVDGDFAAVDWLDKPIDEARLTAAIRRILPRASSRKPRVLHVEDDPDLHRIVATMSNGVADFDVARSVAEARIKLAAETYSLVVLDIGLPDGSGWELLPQLKMLDPEPPVIVLSGTEASSAQLAEVHSTLVKSRTSNQDLLDTIKRLIAARPTGDSTP